MAARTYCPAHFVGSRQEAMGLIAEHPLALVVGPAPHLVANALPLLPSQGDGPLVLRGHVSRANPLWKALPGPVLVVFGGAQAYVSPTWYPSKAQGAAASASACSGLTA